MAKLSKVRLCRLLQLAQQLLEMEAQIAEGIAFLEPFRGVFGITGICLLDASAAEFYTLGSPGGELERRIRAAYRAGQEVDDPVNGITIRRMSVGGRIEGAIAFRGLEDPALTAEPLTSLAATLLPRARSRPEAKAATAVPAEPAAFHPAIFDMLGDDFKNSLATILAATGGLREAGPLRAEQAEMVRLVEEETSRLGSVVSCLDRISRLDQGEVRPRMDSTDLTALVAQIVSQYSQRSLDRQIVFADQGTVLKAIADPEFIRFALSQVLENACKYSVPGSAVRVKIEGRGGAVEVRVVSSDSIPVPSEERLSASGLGLSVARKIATAHGGTLDFDPAQRGTECVGFLLSLSRATDTAIRLGEECE